MSGKPYSSSFFASHFSNGKKFVLGQPKWEFAFHFSKGLKFVLGQPKWEFCTRKNSMKY